MIPHIVSGSTSTLVLSIRALWWVLYSGGPCWASGMPFRDHLPWPFGLRRLRRSAGSDGTGLPGYGRWKYAEHLTDCVKV